MSSSNKLEYARKYYLKNRKTCLKRAEDARNAIKRRIVAYKLLHPCKCGESHPSALDFHHARGNKKFCIGNCRTLPWRKILSEISKCDVVCKNCHAKLHWELSHNHNIYPSSKEQAKEILNEPYEKQRPTRTLSDESKAKISMSMKGKPGYWKGKSISLETKIKMSAAKKGKKFSKSHRKALSLALKGRKLSPSHIESIRQSHLSK